MKTNFTSVLLSFCCLFGKVAACDCLFIPDFCQSITFGNNGVIQEGLQIYRVEVVVQAGNGMEVNIFNTYHGEDLIGHSIFINSGTGGDCRLITTQFVVGEELIISTFKYSDGYSLSDCGVSFLKVENGQVTGPIASGVTEVALADFPDLANCGDLTPTIQPHPPVSVTITPTLARNEVRIQQAQGFLSEDLKLSVFDVTGRQVFRSTAGGHEVLAGVVVSLEDWSAGVYFFRMKLQGRLETVKVVKMGSE